MDVRGEGVPFRVEGQEAPREFKEIEGAPSRFPIPGNLSPAVSREQFKKNWSDQQEHLKDLKDATRREVSKRLEGKGISDATLDRIVAGRPHRQSPLMQKEEYVEDQPGLLKSSQPIKNENIQEKSELQPGEQPKMKQLKIRGFDATHDFNYHMKRIDALMEAMDKAQLEIQPKEVPKVKAKLNYESIQRNVLDMLSAADKAQNEKKKNQQI